VKNAALEGLYIQYCISLSRIYCISFQLNAQTNNISSNFLLLD